MNKEKLYKLALSNIHKYNLLNEIFAIWDKRVDTLDYCIAVNGFISLDVLNQYTNKLEEIDRLNNIINELEKYLKDKTRKVLFDNNGIKEIYADIYLKIKELKGERKELVTLLTNTGCMNIKTHKKLIELVSYFKLNEELKEDK